VIAYILSQFPETHETFILRELIELERRGAGVTIFSLKRPADEIVHSEAKPLVGRTIYSPSVLSPAVLSANLYFLLLRAPSYIYLLVFIAVKNLGSAEAFIKNLYAFTVGAYIAREVGRRGIDRIHAHWATVPTTTAMAAARLAGVPFSFTAHAWDIYWKPTMLAEKVAAARFAVTCTGANREYLASLLPVGLGEKVHLNYHGVDPARFTPIDAKNEIFTITAIGRFVEQKGFEYLLRALRLVVDRGIVVQCRLVGDGPLKAELASLAEELGLGTALVFAGRMSQEQLIPMVAASHAFVMPSVIARNNDRDGIPNVIIEAMALGLPVIGTNVSGLPEIVIDGKTGLLVPERDADSLADAIAALYADRELCTRLGRGGRKLVAEKFDIERNVGELAELLLS